jgi:CRP-like cAMP-binding protein
MSRQDVRWEGLQDHTLAGVATGLGLSPAAMETLRGLIGPVERYALGAPVRSFAPEPEPKLILRGWAFEVRVLADGRRQIFSFNLPGDVLLSRPSSRTNPCDLVALTPLDCVEVTRVLARAGAEEWPELWTAVNKAMAEHVERRYDWITRLGHRSAVQRVAELLLELHDRLDRIGMLADDGFVLPLTQEHMADALGLSVVHVNRSLRTLRLSGLATVRFGRVTHFDAPRLRTLFR